MTEHKKPLTPEDEQIMKDLAEIERTGVVKHDPHFVSLDVNEIARSAMGPTIAGAMVDSAGVGFTLGGSAIPIVQNKNARSSPSYEGPNRDLDEDDAKPPRTDLPKIDTSKG